MAIGNPAAGWSDEARMEELKALWLKGDSASQIAKALGGVTRNAVIGKLHRLGMIRDQPSRPARAAVPRETTLRRRPVTQARQPRGPSDPDLTVVLGGVRFPDMGRPLSPGAETPGSLFGPFRLCDVMGKHLCKWPIGPADQPGEMTMLVCGAPADGPWCFGHRGRAWQPQQPRAPRAPRERDVIEQRAVA